jgi:hypothetical protein
VPGPQDSAFFNRAQSWWNFRQPIDSESGRRAECISTNVSQKGRKRIRNQQVAGSTPAGGSIYLVLNQSITDIHRIDCAVEMPGVGTQAGIRKRGAEVGER